MRKILLGLLILPLAVAAGKTTNHTTPRRILAFYYTWYGTPALEQGKWIHWNECRACTKDPAKIVDAVSPRTGNTINVHDSGTTDHPPALYDSNDPAVVRDHLKIAERAGSMC